MTWQHGTLSGYKFCNGGYRNACQPCRDAQTASSAARRRLAAYGRRNPRAFTDPTRTIQALHWIEALGHNNVAIAKLTGLREPSVWKLLHQQHDKVTFATQDQVLAGLHWALTHPEWQHAPLVPSERSWQQLRSLTALGWPMGMLCRRLGWAGKPAFSERSMKRETADQVQALYDQLSGTRGPSRRAAAYATSLGWHVPLAYDDDGRLVPEAIPNDLTRAAERREDRRDREAKVAELTAQGLGAAEIAARLGISDRTVTRTRSRRPA